ncbi:MAG: polysaccharide deacetylase family protein [bacterium]
MPGNIKSKTLIQLGRLPVPISLFQKFVTRHVVGFVLHIISDNPVPHTKNIYPAKSTGLFEQDLLFLKRHFNFIGYDDLLSANHLSENAAIMSFDDGFAECFSTARPLFLKHEVPCIFFITEFFIDNRRMFLRNKMSLCVEKLRSMAPDEKAEAIGQISTAFELRLDSPASLEKWLKSLDSPDEEVLDKACRLLGVDTKRYLAVNRPYLTTEQVQQMSREGFTFGGHAKTHKRLQLLKNNDEIEEEIAGSCMFVKDLTGQESVPFAFPYDGAGIDTAFLKNLTLKHSFIGPFFDTGKLRETADFIINRITLDGTNSAADRIVRSAYIRQLARQTLRRSQRPLSIWK